MMLDIVAKALADGHRPFQAAELSLAAAACIAIASRSMAAQFHQLQCRPNIMIT